MTVDLIREEQRINAARTEIRSFWEIDVDEWDDVLATNLRGTYFGIRVVGAQMRDRAAGRIVNLASVAGQNSRAVTGVHDFLVVAVDARGEQSRGGHRRGNASTSDFSEAAIAQTVQAAYDIARFTAEDPVSGLPDASRSSQYRPQPPIPCVTLRRISFHPAFSSIGSLCIVKNSQAFITVAVEGRVMRRRIMMSDSLASGWFRSRPISVEVSCERTSAELANSSVRVTSAGSRNGSRGGRRRWRSGIRGYGCCICRGIPMT